MLRSAAHRLTGLLGAHGAPGGVAGAFRGVGGARICFGSVPQPVEEEPSAGDVERGWGRTKIADLLDRKAADMKGDWLFCSKDDKVLDAVKKMAKASCGSLLVFDPSKITLPQRSMPAASDAVVGIITERDYLTKVVVEGKSSASTTVTEIMTPQSKLITLSPEDSVVKAMEVMADHNVRHVPVVRQNAMMGMVSIRDLVKVVVREHREEMEDMKEYIQGMY